MLKEILILTIVFDLFFFNYLNAQKKEKYVLYYFKIREEIAKPVLRTTTKAFEEAELKNADYIIIEINTYGGLVNIADSIRTRILNSKVPVIAFVNNQAISAGALIAISCDSIYMRQGGGLGAATVVDQSGKQLPDKYQSFMRATMRATAEAHGKDTIIKGKDTILIWRRDPRIAEAMVDPSVAIEGVIDSSHVLTLTAEEALKLNYCEGIAENINEVIRLMNIKDYELIEYKQTTLDKIINFLLSPIIQGILIMLMIAGIYYELQTPGIGFPLATAFIAALLYFAPLYLEGLAQNWEILIFLVGLILLILEIFVIPGFGVAGISGIILLLVGLSLAMIDNIAFKTEGIRVFVNLIKSFTIVLSGIGGAIVFILLFSKKMVFSSPSALTLSNVEDKELGYVATNINYEKLIGETGMAITNLRPSGKIEINGEIYYASSEIGFIEKGTKVKVIGNRTGQLIVIKSN